MTEFQDARYYARMDSSLGDKAGLLEHMSGKVLDVGCGDGILLKSIVRAGFEGFGLDSTLESVNRSNSLVPNAVTKLGFADEADKIFGNDFFDTIVCSSVLHEVFSYGASSQPPLSGESLRITVEAFGRALKAGGKLVIRDGVKPANWEEECLVRFSPEYAAEGMRLLDKYLAMIPFGGTGEQEVKLSPVDGESFSGKMGSVMEFLYTYTWGEETFEREAQELYGVFTLEEYEVFLKSMGFKVTQSSEYLQDGYVENLRKKVSLTVQGSPVSFPNSNCVIVASFLG